MCTVCDCMSALEICPCVTYDSQIKRKVEYKIDPLTTRILQPYVIPDRVGQRCIKVEAAKLFRYTKVLRHRLKVNR